MTRASLHLTTEALTDLQNMHSSDMQEHLQNQLRDLVAQVAITADPQQVKKLPWHGPFVCESIQERTATIVCSLPHLNIFTVARDLNHFLDTLVIWRDGMYSLTDSRLESFTAPPPEPPDVIQVGDGHVAPTLFYRAIVSFAQLLKNPLQSKPLS